MLMRKILTIVAAFTLGLLCFNANADYSGTITVTATSTTMKVNLEGVGVIGVPNADNPYMTITGSGVDKIVSKDDVKTQAYPNYSSYFTVNIGSYGLQENVEYTLHIPEGYFTNLYGPGYSPTYGTNSIAYDIPFSIDADGGSTNPDAPEFTVKEDTYYTITVENVLSVTAGKTTGAELYNTTDDTTYGDLAFIEGQSYSGYNIILDYSPSFKLNLAGNGLSRKLTSGEYILRIPAGYFKFDGKDCPAFEIKGIEYLKPSTVSNSEEVVTRLNSTGDKVEIIWTSVNDQSILRTAINSEEAIKFNFSGGYMPLKFNDGFTLTNNTIEIALTTLAEMGTLQTGQVYTFDIPQGLLAFDIESGTFVNAAQRVEFVNANIYYDPAGGETATWEEDATLTTDDTVTVTWGFPIKKGINEVTATFSGENDVLRSAEEVYTLNSTIEDYNLVISLGNLPRDKAGTYNINVPVACVILTVDGVEYVNQDTSESYTVTPGINDPDDPDDPVGGAEVTFYFQDGEEDDFTLEDPWTYVALWNETDGKPINVVEAASMTYEVEDVQIVRIYPDDLDFEIQVDVVGNEAGYDLDVDDGEYYLTLFPEYADGLEIFVKVYQAGTLGGDTDVSMNFNISAASGSDIENPGELVNITYFDMNLWSEVNVTIDDNYGNVTVKPGTNFTLTPAEGYMITSITTFSSGVASISEPENPMDEWNVSVSWSPEETFASFFVTIDKAAYSGTLTPQYTEIGYVASDLAEIISLPVALDLNVAEMVYQGFQFDITLPEYLKVIGGEVSDELKAQSVSTSLYEKAEEPNTYRVVVLLEANDGEGYDATGNIIDLEVEVNNRLIGQLLQAGTLTLPQTDNAVIVENTVYFSDVAGNDIMSIVGAAGEVRIVDATNYISKIQFTDYTLMAPSYTDPVDNKIKKLTAGENLDIAGTLEYTSSPYTNDAIENIVLTVKFGDTVHTGDDIWQYLGFEWDPDTYAMSVQVYTESLEEITEITEATVSIEGVSGSAASKASYTFEVYPRLEGDSNFTGDVTVADVVTTANFTVDLTSDRFDYPNANIIDNGQENPEDEITIDDVTATVQIILGTWDGKGNVRRQASSMSTNDALVADNFKAGQSTIGVNLENTRAYSGIQATVIVPEGMTVTNVKRGNRADDHRLLYNITDDGTVKVVIFSYNNTAFSETEGSLFDLEVVSDRDCGNIRIEGIRAADANSNGYLLNFAGGLSESGANGVEGIEADEAGVRYFTVDGVEVFNPEKGRILIRVEGEKATKVVK